ncbi:MAG: GatB/YqeY domain-containing protein [Actinobacteria bacterium]|nr:GatB/YqeY domain-containing protein [Actinomycetota bacterium]
MELKERLSKELGESLKAGEKIKVSTIRMILSEIKNAEIAKRGELDDDELLLVLAREAKRRKEAIEEFKKGDRQDLVDKETEELGIIETYLPEQLSRDELQAIISETIDEVGASSPGDLGKVMGSIMPKLKGRADGKLVNLMVRETLEKM